MKSNIELGIDWDLLIEKASWHRLSPVISSHLSSPELSGSVPSATLEKLQNISFHSLARNLLIQKELSDILLIFNEREIPVVVLKGMALLGNVYEDISLRPMSDIDILVHPEYIEQAQSIALDLGYMSPVVDTIQEKNRKGLQHLPRLVHREKGVYLEIHDKLAAAESPYLFDISGFWNRARPIIIQNSKALAFSPEDLLIHLCIHFLMDRHYQSMHALGQLLDISKIVSYYGDSLDWNLVDKVAQDFNITPGLHCVFYFCNQLLGTSAPASVIDSWQPSDFDLRIASLFIRRRVMDDRPWLAHDLVPSKYHYSKFRIALSIIKRFFDFPVEIYKRHGFGKNTSILLLSRVGDIFPKIGKGLTRPSELKEDILLDRWLHDLYSPDR